jgi:hypothetical protein
VFGVVLVDRLVGSDIYIGSNYGAGLQARKLRATDFVAAGNAGIGVDASERIRIKNGSLVDNGPGASGIDLRSEHRPRLDNVVCGLSSDGAGGNWGVCQDD